MLNYLVLFGVIFSLGWAGELDLTDANFETEMAKHDLSLVKFYAPWCGHCKRIAEPFKAAASTLSDNEPPVQLVSVDCTVHQKVCKKFDVSGYPTLKVFRNGKNPSDYNGGRTEADLVKVMSSQAGPSSGELKDAAKFEKLRSGKAAIVVGFFADENADGYKSFKAAADELREKVKFAHTFSPAVFEAAGKSAGTISVFRPSAMKSKFEDQVVDYSKSKFTLGLIRNFAKDTVAGLCPVVKDQEDLGYPQVIAFYNVDYERDPKGTQYWRNRVMKIAKNEKYNDIKFGVASRTTFAGVLNEMNLADADKSKPVVVAWANKEEKFIMTETFTPDGATFDEFLTSYQAGELEAYIKSEPIPADNSSKANKILVKKNFEEFVDGSKDVFVYFYAPWCGHCKTLAPKWDEMAEEFKDDDSVVIGKYDATANDVPPGFEVQGFPTIFWIPKGGQPQKYQSGRETKDLVKWVQDNHKAAKEEL